MARKGRVYHRYPEKLRRTKFETECIVSFDGGETFEGFRPKKAHTEKHKIERDAKTGEWVLIEKKLR